MNLKQTESAVAAVKFALDAHNVTQVEAIAILLAMSVGIVAENAMASTGNKMTAYETQLITVEQMFESMADSAREKVRDVA